MLLVSPVLTLCVRRIYDTVGVNLKLCNGLFNMRF